MSKGKFLESRDPQVQKNFYVRTHVLVIEDDEIAASIATRFLLDLDCTVEWKGSSQQALEIFEQNNDTPHYYDLVFMDISLPSMNGMLLTEKIRETKRYKNKPVPIIALTAYGDQVYKEKCFKAGMQGFIEKPLMKTTAYEVLQRFFPRWKERAELNKFNMQFDETSMALVEESIDFNQALQIHDGDIDFIKVSLQVIIDRLAIELEGLRLFCESKDWDQSRVVLHRLRGGASYFGLMKLDNICTTFTQVLKNNPENWKSVHAILNQEIDHVRKAYRIWLDAQL